MPVALKPSASQHRMLLKRIVAGAETASGSGDKAVAAWALPNVAELLSEMIETGGGLVKKASLPSTGHAMASAAGWSS